MDSLIKYIFLAYIFIFQSCYFFKKQNPNIYPNSFTDKYIYFSELDEFYSRSKSFNKVWSRLYSKRFRPYHKFKNKKYKIMGSYNNDNIDYFVIEDVKNRMYKMNFSIDQKTKNLFPSYIIFEDTLNEAKKMIGKVIWLNNVLDPKNFYSFSDYNFQRFSKVIVKDLMDYQNSDVDYPIWLKVQSKLGHEAFVRYNGEEGRTGFKDHYFIEDPLPSQWGEIILKNIIEKKIVLGMSARQVRISIGNPDVINITSSRHGISEQWIYKNRYNKSIYYQFEYGKLSYISQ